MKKRFFLWITEAWNGFWYTWPDEGGGMNMKVGGPMRNITPRLNMQRIYNISMAAILIILATLIIMSCAPTVPTIARHNYLGTVVKITDGPAYQTVHLSNGTDYAAVDSVAIGDYVYRNPYGQLKIIHKDDL